MNLQKKNYDSAFCGNLPLQHLNIIQPHGVLIVVNSSDLRVIQVSENIDTLFGIKAPAFVDTPLSDYLTAESRQLLLDVFAKATAGKIPLTITCSYQGRRQQALCVTHAKPGYWLLDIYPPGSDTGERKSYIDILQQIKHITAALDAAADVDQLCRIAVEQLRALGGFDKVMIYRFDADWNGKVIAESKAEEMEAYFGLTFPASDIPRQARQLYMRNPYRLIPNRQYEPVKIYPVINPVTNAFVDLSDSEIRGVAAVHLEYMQNMRINASMSTRIMLQEQLWGLISCHHRTARYLDYETCGMFEMLSQAISAKLALLLHKEQYAHAAQLQAQHAKLISQVYAEKSLVKGLLQRELSLLQLMDAGGVVISYNKMTEHAGQVPDRNTVKELIFWLQTLQVSDVYKEESLVSVYDKAVSFAEIGSGLLVLSINPAKGDFIMFFRPEVQRKVHWGGNPDEAIRFEQNNVTYHPRNSFQVWQQTVKHTSLPWKQPEIDMAVQFRIFLLEYIVRSSVRTQL